MKLFSIFSTALTVFCMFAVAQVGAQAGVASGPAPNPTVVTTAVGSPTSIPPARAASSLPPPTARIIATPSTQSGNGSLGPTLVPYPAPWNGPGPSLLPNPYAGAPGYAAPTTWSNRGGPNPGSLISPPLSYPYPWNSPYPAMIPNPYANDPAYAPPAQPNPGPSTPFWNGTGYYYPSTVIVLTGFYFPDYCAGYYNSYVLPSVYGLYIGMPGYFYDPSSSVAITQNGVFSFGGGQWFDVTNNQVGSGPIVFGGDKAARSQITQILPVGLRRSLSAISSAWTKSDPAAIDGFLAASSGRRIQVALNGNSYGYSIDPRSFDLMTRDAMRRLSTTSFKFTGVRMQPNGDATGYAVHSYRALNGQSSSLYVAYTLVPDSARPAGYDLVGVQSSNTPLDDRDAGVTVVNSAAANGRSRTYSN